MNLNKKNVFISFFCLTILLSFSSPDIYADDAKARSIMEKADALDDGDNSTANMTMILIDKNGKERIRKIRSFGKDKGEDSYRLMFFISPADVKDTGFLTFDYDDPKKDDDQWLYLPALRKTKRIASSDKSGSFMGSDLNYSDMTKKDLDDYDYTLKKEMKVRGKKVWVIESIPRTKRVIEETGYKKSLVFVQQDNYYIVRAISWEEDGGYLKYMDVRKLEKIDGIWIGTERHVTRKIGKKTIHKTILKFENMKFNQKLGYKIFTTRRLEKGL